MGKTADTSAKRRLALRPAARDTDGMAIQLVIGLGMSVFLAIGGLVAWQVRKQEEHRDQPQWRDDSLDEWRRERDAAAEAERREREAHRAEAELHDGAEREEEQTQRQQRIGG